MTLMGMPTVPPRTRTDVGNGIAFTAGHHFTVAADADIS
jgi:hypothetical protein